MIFNLLSCLIYSVTCFIGASLGIGISFIVNCTLIEICKSPYFAYVNILFYFLVFWNIFLDNRNIYINKIIEKSSNYFPKS